MRWKSWQNNNDVYMNENAKDTQKWMMLPVALVMLMYPLLTQV